MEKRDHIYKIKLVLAKTGSDRDAWSAPAPASPTCRQVHPKPRPNRSVTTAGQAASARKDDGMATSLHEEAYEIPAADLGPENPLPVFRGAEDDGRFSADPKMPEEDRRYLGWRTARRTLPYRLQDGYNRQKRPQTFRSL